MAYTIKRDGKTYEEYKEDILKEVKKLKLPAGEESSKLAELYTENDAWFESNQAIEDDKKAKKEIKDRFDKIKDINLAISFANLQYANPALLESEIVNGNLVLLESLEAVSPEIDNFYEKEKAKKEKMQELKSWAESVDVNNLTQDDLLKIHSYIIEKIAGK